MPNRPRPVTELLSSSSNLRLLLAQSQEQRSLLKQIHALLPPPLDRHCRAVLAKQQRLILYTDSPAWASRLRFFSRNLLDQLSKTGLGYKRVVVRVTLPREPTHRKPRRSQRLSPGNAELLAQVAETIDDPLLGAALRRLGQHG
jgi:hypothetical protein